MPDTRRTGPRHEAGPENSTNGTRITPREDIYVDGRCKTCGAELSWGELNSPLTLKRIKSQIRRKAPIALLCAQCEIAQHLRRVRGG